MSYLIAAGINNIKNKMNRDTIREIFEIEYSAKNEKIIDNTKIVLYVKYVKISS